jgi:serine/threonine-protein phosphatase 2A regulatory subunit A
MMATKMDPDTARLEVLPLVLEMATDIVSLFSYLPRLFYPHRRHQLTAATVYFTFPQVPNIRFNVAKELETITPNCGFSAYESQVHPVLAMLLEDDDRDVRFFAEKTETALNKYFASTAT